MITTANYQLYTTLTASTTLALVFVIAMGLFLVELLMLPLQLVRSLLKRSSPQPTAAYILRFGLSGLAVAALVFVVGLASVLLPMFRSAPTDLVIGIPRTSSALLISPTLIVLVSVVLLVLMWSQRWWSPLIRIHMTAVAGAAFVFSWTMAQAGYLGLWV